MVKTLNTPSNSLHKRQGKDKHFEVQMKQGLCKVSKHRAGYYTTDTNLFTRPLKLF